MSSTSWKLVVRETTLSATSAVKVMSYEPSRAIEWLLNPVIQHGSGAVVKYPVIAMAVIVYKAGGLTFDPYRGVLEFRKRSKSTVAQY